MNRVAGGKERGKLVSKNPGTVSKEMTSARGSSRTAAWDSDLWYNSAMEALTIPEDVPPPPPAQRRPKCPHDRERYYCKDCGGKGICQHDLVKKQCRECNGKAFCPEPGCNKRKAYCGAHAEDPPASVCDCDFGRQRKSRCRQHGGSELCPCDRLRSSCPTHGPQCECGIVKITCLTHGPFCQCGIRRSDCEEHGDRHCPCGKRRIYCAKHGGSALCPCGKRRQLCAKHGGSGLCACGKRREYCTKCVGGGLGLCDKHQKRWDKCKECSQPSDAQADEQVGEPVEQPAAATPPPNARRVGSAHREVEYNMVPEQYM